MGRTGVVGLSREDRLAGVTHSSTWQAREPIGVATDMEAEG